MTKDWFRKNTWTIADRSDFEAHLGRARASKRPQYLYLRAGELFAARRPDTIQAALALAARSIIEFPPHVHTSAAHDLRGQCFEVLGDKLGALRAYREAVKAERAHRCILTDAYLHFSWLIAVGGIHEFDPEALALLDEFADRAAFPVQRFQSHAARSLFALHAGSLTTAAAEARLALEAASNAHSGFAHHQNLGLVGSRFAEIRARLVTIAG